MKKILPGLLLLITISTSVNASGYLTPFSASNVKITHYFTHSGGGVTLLLSGPVINPDGCTVATRVHLKGSLAGHNAKVK